MDVRELDSRVAENAAMRSTHAAGRAEITLVLRETKRTLVSTTVRVALEDESLGGGSNVALRKCRECRDANDNPVILARQRHRGI